MQDNESPLIPRNEERKHQCREKKKGKRVIISINLLNHFKCPNKTK